MKLHQGLLPLALATFLGAAIISSVRGRVVLGPNASLPQLVAAGDIDQRSVVLWTRTEAPGKVDFEVAQDPTFAGPRLKKSAVVADPDRPAKQFFRGLRPGRQYHYRVTDALGAVAVGSFRTAQDADALHGLHFGVTGDARGDNAPHDSIANA